MTDDATLRAHDERRDFASARARFRALTDAPDPWCRTTAGWPAW